MTRILTATLTAIIATLLVIIAAELTQPVVTSSVQDVASHPAVRSVPAYSEWTASRAKQHAYPVRLGDADNASGSAAVHSGIAQPLTGRKGTATWCAPTPSHCQGWGGNAHVGAMRSFRYGDRPYFVRVTSQGLSTVVRVVSYCACPRTLIDLSPAAFDDLAPLSAGRIRVVVSGLRVPEPPATDR